MDFNERLKNLLKENNLTNYKVAKDLRLPESTIRSWLKGRAIPRQKHMIVLAKYFKVSPAWLQYGDLEYAPSLHNEALRIAAKIEEFAKKDPSFLQKAETMIDILGDSRGEFEQGESHLFQRKKVKKRKPAA